MGSQRRKPQKHSPIPEDLAGRMAAFAKLIVEAKDLGEVSAFFHDHLVTLEAFMTAGKRAEHPRLMALVRTILKLQSGSSSLRDPLLAHIPEYGFWHGMGNTQEGGMAIFYHFDTPNRGVVQYSRSLSDPSVIYSRFSIPEDMSPDLDPEQVSLMSMNLRRREDDEPN